MRDEIYGTLFILIIGMGIGSALNGLYFSYEVDNLNTRILEFNIASELYFGQTPDINKETKWEYVKMKKAILY